MLVSGQKTLMFDDILVFWFLYFVKFAEDDASDVIRRSLRVMPAIPANLIDEGNGGCLYKKGKKIPSPMLKGWGKEQCHLNSNLHSLASRTKLISLCLSEDSLN